MPEWLSYIDIAFVIIVFLFAWGGSQKGFAAQLAHTLTFAIFGVLLFYAYPATTEYLSRVFRDLHETYLMWLLLAAFIVLGVLIFILMNKMLAGIIKMQLSDKADQVNGFILGLIRGLLTALLVMTLLILLGSERTYQMFSAKSYVGQVVCREFVPRIQPHVNRSVVSEKVDAVRNKMLQREEGGKLEE